MRKLRRARWLLLLAVLGLLGAGAFYWPAAPGGQSEAPKLEPPAPVEHWIHAVGYVEPRSEVRRLVFRADGVIERCFVAIGTAVKKGDKLMTLYDRDQAAAVEVAQRDVAVARAELAKVASGIDRYEIAAAHSKVERLRESVRHMTRENERSRRMFQTASASDLEAEQARTQQAQAEASLRNAEAELQHLEHFVRPEDLALAEARVHQAEARLALARERLEETLLTAPCNGTVLEVLKREGEGQRLIDAEPAVVFADVDRLRVRAEIDERYARKIRVGQRAVAFGRGLGTESFIGQVAEVKRIMGKKTVFARTAQERKDLEILQVLIDMADGFTGPVGLRVDVKIAE
jgi:HlyD family secretion protein